MIYYPIPIHLQKPFADSRFLSGERVLSEEIALKIISLPIHTELNIEQLSHITSMVNKFLD